MKNQFKVWRAGPFWLLVKILGPGHAITVATIESPEVAETVLRELNELPPNEWVLAKDYVDEEFAT